MKNSKVKAKVGDDRIHLVQTTLRIGFSYGGQASSVTNKTHWPLVMDRITWSAPLTAQEISWISFRIAHHLGTLGTKNILEAASWSCKFTITLWEIGSKCKHTFYNWSPRPSRRHSPRAPANLRKSGGPTEFYNTYKHYSASGSFSMRAPDAQ